MWTARFSFDGNYSFIGSRTKKHKINLFGYPLSYFYGKKHITVQITGLLFGEEKNKNAFIKDLKGSERLIDMDVNGDFFIATITEPLFAKKIYNKNIIHLEPALIDENARETVNVGSFSRKSLGEAIAALKTLPDGKLLSITQRKVKNITIIRENPELTDKQKQAMRLAIKNGYYDYPRKTDLPKLAKMMTLSYSTYQAHLRKAEQKLIPFYFES